MKSYLLLLSLVLALPGFYSCEHSSENDTILFVPKQVREVTIAGETSIVYSLSYDAVGRIKTEADPLYSASLSYNSNNELDSVRVTYSTTNTADSLHLIFIYGEGLIEIRQVMHVNGVAANTTLGQLTLNAQQLPLVYTMGSTEERYSYDTGNRLTAVEHYESSVLTWKRTYEYGKTEYGDIKSPYSEVLYFPAWYFTAYRHMSPAGFTEKASEEKGGQTDALYELSGFTISDLGFITQASKIYREGSGSREVTYRQDYSKQRYD